MSRETIKVCCRFRKEFDHADDEYDNWLFDEETSTIYHGEKTDKNSKKWTYDYILPPDTSQAEMNEKVAKKTIIDFTEGYNGTIFAYGQSGSGKTYSMLGPDSVLETLNTEKENPLYGVIPRAVHQIFDILKEFSRNGTKWKLSLSYIEIYNEKIKCLLSKKDSLKIREDPHIGFIIPEKQTIDCQTPNQIFDGINLANKNRAVGATNQNEHSSRSHAILQLELIYNSIDGLVRKSVLNLVDLAGSERIAKTGAEGQRLKEAQKINQSLTTLGMVIMALTTPGTKHVPFRNSKLTLILKDSLGGSSKTTLLCTASRLKRHSDESIQTLYFAARAKTIKTNAKKNIILSAGELQYLADGLKKEILILRGQIKKGGYKWHFIEDKKLINFCNNEDFIGDNNNLIKDINEDNTYNSDITNEKKLNENVTLNENNNNNNNVISDSEKDQIIKDLKENMVTERELMQLIIDELNDKVSEKELEIAELQNQISILKSGGKIDDISSTSSTVIEISKYHQENKELKKKISELVEKNKTIQNERDKLSDNNIFISEENRRLRTQINEMRLQLEELKKLIEENETQSNKNEKLNKRGSAFGVTLKKVEGNNTNYLAEARKEHEKQQKIIKNLFANSTLFNELHKCVAEEYDSPRTVSSNDDILELDIPDIDFADIENNGEAFKKVEEALYEKEQEHIRQKSEKVEKEGNKEEEI